MAYYHNKRCHFRLDSIFDFLVFTHVFPFYVLVEKNNIVIWTARTELPVWLFLIEC